MPSAVAMAESESAFAALINTPRTYKAAKASKFSALLNQPLQIAHQRVSLDIDLEHHRIEGLTEITVVPTASNLKSVVLDCRGIKIKSLVINKTRVPNYIYNDYLYVNDDALFDKAVECQTLNLFDIYNPELSIHQHQLIRQKLNNVFGEPNYDPRDPSYLDCNGDTGELTVILPENLKLHLDHTQSFLTPGSAGGNSATPLHLKLRSSHTDTYTSFQIRIEYELINPTNGFTFITDSPDKRDWLAYTTNCDFNISTSSWVPCIDNLRDKCTWSIEISLPRTVRDIGRPRLNGADSHKSSYRTRANRYSNRIDEDLSMAIDEVPGSSNETDQTTDHDSDELIVCCGDYKNVKETPHPSDQSKKVVSWALFTPVCSHHVGWTIGCFQSFLLAQTSLTEDPENEKDQTAFDDDEKDVANNPVMVYCHADQIEAARNTCVFANSAMDFFLTEYGAFPFSSYSIVFVRNCIAKTNTFAGLSVVNEDLLYPPNLIEPLVTSTDSLVESLATQWAGINIVPQTFNDLWCTIGICKYMALQYIRQLMGTNEYKFRVKRDMDRIIEQDVGKTPLALQFYRFPIAESDLDFIRLKAPIIMFILDKRMTKTDKSFGFSRVLPKLFLQAMLGDLQNGSLSTQHFQYICERVNRNKLETFFKQWIFGVGTPSFHISHRLNKKRGVIEMSIRQLQQQDTKKKKLSPSTFVNDSIAFLDGEPTYKVQNVFTGPMTIRVHEADGTPYEHIVEVKEGHTKLEIHYNSRFRRKKKDEFGEVATQVHRLGDVLTSEADMSEWGLAEWQREEEETVSTDAFEWLRIDVDYEWIAKFDVKQPDYMYASQLCLDRDVEAQYEATKFFGNLSNPTSVQCTVLVRTIMDERYYYGVRAAAANALANCSRDSNNFFGLRYLVKVFKRLFCFEDSTVPRSNDFTDFGKFFLQKSMVRIMSNIRDERGDVPETVKQLVLSVVQYNENSNNGFDDSFYLAELIECLTDCALNGILPVVRDIMGKKVHLEPAHQKYVASVISELTRAQKLDEWVPSYQRVVSITCLRQKIKLARHGLYTLSFEDLLYLTTEKTPAGVRVEAFRGLFLLGGLRNSAILEYYLKACILRQNTPDVRHAMIQDLLSSISIAAIEGSPSGLDDAEFQSLESVADTRSHGGENDPANILIIEDGNTKEMDSKRDAFARATLQGAIEILRRDYAIGHGLQSVMSQLIHQTLISINERRDVFNILQILFKPQDKLMVTLPVPNLPLLELRKKLVLRNLGEGRLVIRREGRFKIQLASRKSIVADHHEPRNARSETRHRPPSLPDSSSAKPAEPKVKLSLSLKPSKPHGLIASPLSPQKSAQTPSIKVNVKHGPLTPQLRGSRGRSLFAESSNVVDNKGTLTLVSHDSKQYMLTLRIPKRSLASLAAHAPQTERQLNRDKILRKESESETLILKLEVDGGVHNGHASPLHEENDQSCVIVDGTTVKFRLKRSGSGSSSSHAKVKPENNGLEEHVPAETPRYVKIHLASKKVTVSNEPF